MFFNAALAVVVVVVAAATTGSRPPALRALEDRPHRAPTMAKTAQTKPEMVVVVAAEAAVMVAVLVETLPGEM
jgi:hypothetical protein